MEPIDYILQSLQNDITKVEIISQNLANAQTPGYQASNVFAEYLGSGEGNQIISALTHSPGTVKKTQRSLDVALLSNHYLQVEFNGAQLLTRQGRLHLDKEGNLLHASGGKVLGESGFINLPEGEVSISESGEIRVNGNVVDKLLFAENNSKSSLQYQGAGLYQTTIFQPAEGRVEQFALNSANVNSTQDMIRLIETSRHAESLQRALHALDQINNAGINELGKK